MSGKKERVPGKRIRIAHLQLLPLLTGVQRVSLEELSRLDRSRFEPFAICKEEGPFTQALKAEGIPYFCVPELTRPISPWMDLRALRELVSLFRAQKFDIIHTHSSKTGILGRLAGRIASVPVVMHTVHGYAFPAAKNPLSRGFFRFMEWVGGRLADAIILLNRHDLDIAQGRLGIPTKKLHLIPNGVDPDRHAPPKAAERERIRKKNFGVAKDEVAVGMVGRLWRQKNPACFVRAAIRLLKEGASSVRFFLIGDGEEREGLEAIARKSGFGDRIRILGWRGDVEKLLGGLDIFVLPSLWEGLPLAILEAMASGLPVVASDIPGNRDLVMEGRTGFLFPVGDEEALAAKLLPLLLDRSRARRLGIAGRKRALAHHSLKERKDQMERLYSGSLAQKKTL